MGIFDHITKYPNLEELNKAWENCNKCTLRQPNGIVCSSITSTKTKVLVVGKGPTLPESITGRGMMTDPGGVEIRKWFGKLARYWGLSEDEIGYSNVVHCPSTIRDPNKKDYRVDEEGNVSSTPVIPSEQCSKYLEEEIAIIKPTLIISIGSTAFNYFAKRSKSIPSNLAKARKNTWRYRNAFFIPVVMPISTTEENSYEIAEDFHFLRLNAFGNVNKVAAKDILSLTDTYIEMDSCKACGLCDNTKNKVFGNGWTRSPIMFVGEAPGAQENETGAPFVGAAGKYLWHKVLKRVDTKKCSLILDRFGNIDYKKIYVTNAVKGWPGDGNPTPKSEEIMACNPFLQSQVRIVKPKVIVCLGKTAVEAVTGLRKSMKNLRKEVHKCLFTDSKVVATWHPSYAMRREKEDNSLDAMEEMISDINTALEFIETT
jgi:uracil-DNA glycosylase family 4